MSKVTRGLRKMSKAARAKAPQIILGLEIASFATTVVSAITQTPKAECVLADYKREMQECAKEDMTDREMLPIRAEYAWDMVKTYLPTIISGSLTVYLMITGHKRALRSQALLVGALNIAQQSLYDYRDAVKEVVKPKDFDKIDEVYNRKIIDRIDEPPVERDRMLGALEDTVYQTGHGNQLFYDIATGTKFRSNKEFIDHQLLEMSHQMIFGGDQTATLDDYLRMQHIRKRIDGAEELGWCDADGQVEANIHWDNYKNPQTCTDEPIGIIHLYPKPHANYIPNLHG